MSIRDLLCELKLPAVLISVVTIVWCTAMLSHQEEQRYYGPDEQFTRLQQTSQQTTNQNPPEGSPHSEDETVRLELEP